MRRLENKVAVVTGGASGIGLATAKEFKKEGAKIVIFDIDNEALSEASKFFNGDLLAVQGDVRKQADLKNLFQETHATYGKVDVLYANAGLGVAEPVGQVTEEAYDKMMDVNVKGVFFTVQNSLPYLTNPASVILTCSAATQLAMPGLCVYTMTKMALRSLAKGLSAELIDRGIRVNVVSPGVVYTPAFQKLGLTNEQIQGMLDGEAQKNLMKRTGQAEEVAKAVVFLASSESSYTIGSEVQVDGGHTIRS